MKFLQPGDDHNLLGNRNTGDPHPIYSKRADVGKPGGPLPMGTHIGQVLYWDGFTWVPDQIGPTQEPMLMLDASNSGIVLGAWGAASDPVHVVGNTFVEKSIAFAQTAISTTPYTLNATQNALIGVVTTTLAITVNLPSVSQPLMYIIKDVSGNANVRNITIVPNGADTIEGAANLIINTPYGRAWLISDQVSKWLVIG